MRTTFIQLRHHSTAVGDFTVRERRKIGVKGGGERGGGKRRKERSVERKCLEWPSA